MLNSPHQAHSRETPDSSGRCATAHVLPDKSGVPVMVSRCASERRTSDEDAIDSVFDVGS
jgi:hypothetical protein